jgi:hypothetical protein
MKHAASLAVTLLLSLGALTGCGDIQPAEDVGPRSAEVGKTMDPRAVESKFASSSCPDDPESPCIKSQTPNVEVYVDGRCLILDFSNVATPGRFGEETFQGFVFEVDQSANSPILVAHANGDASTLDIESWRVSHGSDYVEINLAGLEYDSDDFIQIDLLIGPLRLFGNRND